MEPLVSVIIPIYNVEKYIEKCINSILKQTYKNLEIILINDGSTDNSLKICYELSNKDKRIRVINKKNEGVSIARNTGIDSSTGDYIFFIDSDDYVDENAIYELIKNANDCDIVKISYKLIRKEKESKIISNNKSYKMNKYIKEVLLGTVGGHSWGYLLNKSIIKDFNFDENTSCMEDTIFIINCILKSQNIKCIDSSYYNYRINENGITCSTNRIFKNINDYMYSLDEIEKIISKSKIDYNCHDDILIKKVDLIECEIAKITTKKELEVLFKDENIKQTLNHINTSIKVNLVYKIFIYFITNKKYNMTILYLKTRRFIKNIIKGRI